ncbi:MAG: TonB-dependent receptor [Acidobacteria bacterium]|nr:TonB-dependent receptor [Acidobacteriota bacterium]
MDSFLTARPLTIAAKLGDTSLPGSVAGPLPTQGLRETIVGIYGQDDFSVTPNLTLNLGLRYEFQTNPTEVAGRLANLDEPTDSVLRIGNPLWSRNPSRKNFGPRVGLAWDPLGDGKTSVRAGAGIFYDLVGPERLLGPQQQPPFFSQVSPLFPLFPNVLDGITPALIKGNPAIFVYKTPKQAYVGQYNLTLQREILPETVVTVGYQGSRGIKLGRLLDANLAPVQIQDGRYFWPADSRRQNTNFSQIRAYFWDGNSFFNSLRVGVQHRFSHGFQFQSSYTYSRAIDESSNTANFDTARSNSNGVSTTPFDHKLDRGLASFDVRHVYSFNSTFELPFGPGKLWGKNLTGIAAKVAGGWQVSSILSLSTGAPVNARLGDNRSRSQSGPDVADRPDLRPGASNNPVLGGPDRYFDPEAFILQAAGFWGNVGRNTLIGPGLANFDLSLVKDTPLRGEERKVEFRAEFFNLANRANFGNPANFVFSGGARLGNAGRITTTTTTSRQIQFALKLIF